MQGKQNRFVAAAVGADSPHVRGAHDFYGLLLPAAAVALPLFTIAFLLRIYLYENWAKNHPLQMQRTHAAAQIYCPRRLRV